VVEPGEQRRLAGQRARSALDQVDAVQELVQVGAGQEGQQGLPGGAAVRGQPRPDVQAELEVVVAAGLPPDPVDQDHVGVVPDGQVRRVPGGVGEPAQVGGRDLAQLQGSQHREAQVEHPFSWPDPCRVRVCLDKVRGAR